LDSRVIDTIKVEYAPAIEGLTFRNFRGDEDYPAMLEVNNGSKVEDDLGHDLHTLETLKYVYGTTPNHDPLKDVLIAEVDGKMVAFIRIFWEKETDGNRAYWHYGFVLPEWRERGMGRAMVRWANAHAREIEASLGSGGLAHISTSVYSTMPLAESLMKEEQYAPVRYSFNMETPDLDHIPDAPMPEGLEVRPATPEHYGAIWAASAEAFQDHWGATEIDEADYDRWLTDPRLDHKLWQVAWEGDQVAGMILNFINYEYNERTGRKLGYTEDISVRRPWRRRGLARALLSRSMKMFKDMGMEQTALGVDTENPSGALQLYESMGYREVMRDTVYRKNL